MICTHNIRIVVVQHSVQLNVDNCSFALKRKQRGMTWATPL